MEAMGELMAAKNTRADLIKILPTRLGNSGNFVVGVKWEFLFYYFIRKRFGEESLFSRFRAKGPDPK